MRDGTVIGYAPMSKKTPKDEERLALPALVAFPAFALSVPVRPLVAQEGSVLERLNLDRLQLAALGIGSGAVRAAHARPP